VTVISVALAGIAGFTALFLHIGPTQRANLTRLPAGAPLRDDHRSIRLVSLESAETRPSSFNASPGKGASWVVATFEAQVFDDEGFVCVMNLVGTDGRRWDSAWDGWGDDDATCPTDPTPAPVTFRKLFIVPTSDLDRLAGVALYGDGRSGYLITPPEED
jgi:hypothetical protein